MDKTAFQIEKFLLQNPFKSERDCDVISAYITSKYNLKLKMSKNYDQDNGIDYHTFIDWLDNGFAQGETVIINNELAILKEAAYKFAVIGCKIHQDLTAELGLSETVSIESLKKCSDQDVKNANDSLQRLGLEVNNKSLLIAKKYIPSSNEPIKFYNNTEEGYGIVRTISDNKVIMYCYFTISGSVHCSMNELLGDIYDYTFEHMTVGYKRRLDMELRKAGKKWNQYSKRVESINYKLKKGKFYYYINDKLKVVRAIDDEGGVATHRYLSGNYYHGPSEAIEDLAEWTEYRRNKIAQQD